MSTNKKNRTNSNEKRFQQLGMPHGTAANRLRKMILFSLVQQTELDICFKCGEIINSVENLSIEHKAPWLDSEDPRKLFFDLDNIAFSHSRCNHRRVIPKKQLLLTCHECRKEFKRDKASQRVMDKRCNCNAKVFCSTGCHNKNMQGQERIYKTYESLDSL